MYDRILVPTDGSEGADLAIEHAIDLAKTYDATLHALYVVQTDVGPDAGLGGIYDALEEAGENAIEDVLKLAQSANVRSVEGSLAHGSPYRGILRYIEEKDIDLVVMGTHGRTGLDRYLLGSVTEKVVPLSDVPVLTVPLRA